METPNLATNWEKTQPTKEANKTSLWAWFYSWAPVCETLSKPFIVFCDIILERMKDCSISFWHYWFPKYGLTPPPLVQYYFVPPSSDFRVCPTLEASNFTPLLVLSWTMLTVFPPLLSSHTLNDKWMALPPWKDNSFLHIVAILCISLCINPCVMMMTWWWPHPRTATCDGELEDNHLYGITKGWRCLGKFHDVI